VDTQTEYLLLNQLNVIKATSKMMVDSNFDGAVPTDKSLLSLPWLGKILVDVADDNLMIYKTITTKTIKKKKEI